MKYLCEDCQYNSANNYYEPHIEVRNGSLYRQDICHMGKQNYPKVRFCPDCEDVPTDPEAA